MALPNLYSRRKRLATKTGDDVYQYHMISSKLRVQLLFMFNTWDDRYRDDTGSGRIMTGAGRIMRTELGTVSLTGAVGLSEDFQRWFTSHNVVDNILDSVEVCVNIAIQMDADDDWADTALLLREIAELNARMLEDGFGFQIEGGQIVQLSSTFVHKEVTVPALALLAGAEYATANDEFRQAYQEFNQGSYDDCIHDCCNAFESVLKVILTKKGWAFSPNDTAKKLLDAAFANGLIPSYMQTEFTGLRTILESGVPTVRNKDGGHGAGATPRVIPKHIASFQLHQTAAAIILLVEAAK